MVTQKLEKIRIEELESLLTTLSKDFPITIRFIEPILERIYEQYPLVDRTIIAIVVRGFFVVLRKKLLSGESISLSSFFRKFGFYVGYKIIGENRIKQIRVRIRTPLVIRNGYGKR